MSVVVLERNHGKGEAVRVGLIHASRLGNAWIGYVDADLATPVGEILRLLDIATNSVGIDVVLASRIAMLGRDVRRSAFRHYTGRVFATFASAVLGKPVYDTQCGAKLFRRTAAMDRSIAVPFHSRWAFDVELLGRLDANGVPPSAFREEPLQAWHDIAGSRRRVWASVRATADLLVIRRHLRNDPRLRR